MDKTGVIYMSITFHSHITSKKLVENEEPKKAKNPLFLPQSLCSLRFSKMDKIYMIYMFVAFHSYIKCENQPKYDRAMQQSKYLTKNLYKACRAILHIFF